MEEKTKQLEALLFLAGEPMPRVQLARTLEVSIDDIARLLEELKTALAEHGVALVDSGSHVQLATAPAVREFVRQFIQGELSTLSAAAAETLALVAYRGPISRTDIDAIRGVDSRRILRQLLQRGLVARESSAKNTSLYTITTDFLHHLGLEGREQLPEFEALSSDEQVRALLSDAP